MEPQGLQHLLEFDLPHVVQCPHLIQQLYGLHEDGKKSHGRAYANSLLIQGPSLPFICRSQRFLHLPYV
jgi:hypothetical protein